MNKNPLLYLCSLLILFSSCTQYAYYQSPLHTNTNSYKAIPLTSDSIRTATYASGVFITGGANENQRDGFNGFTGFLHQSQRFGVFRGYYGLTGSLGNYHVKSYTGQIDNSYKNDNLNDSLINTRSGGKFFGSWGAIGGVNVVLPFEKGGEWRILGAEVSWQKEFGDYLSFRRNLPDTAANVIDRHDQFFTIALNTDLLFRTRKGSFGFKLGPVFSTRSITGYDKNRKPYNFSSGYFSHTFHLTINRFTGFCQLNFGEYAIGSHLGLNYRLNQ